MSELRFADARNGWAFGPDLWVTHDGGSHWHSVELGTVDALAASGGHAVAVVGSGSRYRVLRTAAGSDAWRTVAEFRQRDYAAAEGDLSLSGVAGWIAGQSSLAVSRDSVSWRLVANPCKGYSGGGGGGAWLTSPTDGVLACAGQGAAGSEQKPVFGSSDGGRVFTLLGRPPFGGDFDSVAANRRFTVLVAASSGASEIYASFDGGRHYQTVLELNDGGVGWRDLGFTTDQQGVAVEADARPDRLFMTRDGGHHWQAVRFASR